jgi:hypothetical protein
MCPDMTFTGYLVVRMQEHLSDLEALMGNGQGFHAWKQVQVGLLDI